MNTAAGTTSMTGTRNADRRVWWRVCSSATTLMMVMALLGTLTAPAGATDRFGLLFVYAASCPASRAVSPALKAVARHQNLPVLAVSADGYRLDAWPGTRPEAGQLAHLGIRRVPFVGLFDAHTGRLDVITNRALPAAVLHTRIAGQITTKSGALQTPPHHKHDGRRRP